MKLQKHLVITIAASTLTLSGCGLFGSKKNKPFLGTEDTVAGGTESPTESATDPNATPAPPAPAAVGDVALVKQLDVFVLNADEILDSFRSITGVYNNNIRDRFRENRDSLPGFDKKLTDLSAANVSALIKVMSAFSQELFNNNQFSEMRTAYLTRPGLITGVEDLNLNQDVSEVSDTLLREVAGTIMANNWRIHPDQLTAMEEMYPSTGYAGSLETLTAYLIELKTEDPERSLRQIMEVAFILTASSLPAYDVIN